MGGGGHAGRRGPGEVGGRGAGGGAGGRRAPGADRAQGRRHRTVRWRQRDRRLPAGGPVADDGDPRRRPGQPDLRRAARDRQQRPEGRAGGAGALVPAGSRERALVHHRRQRRDQRRWPVLPEVRGHPRLRARAARGGGRSGGLRHRRPAGPPDHQRRCRIRHRRPDGRIRGHPRGGHRGDVAAAARGTRRSAHGGRRVRLAGRRRPGGGPRHPPGPEPVGPGTAGPHVPACRRGLEAPGHRGGRHRAAARPRRHPGGRRRTRGTRAHRVFRAGRRSVGGPVHRRHRGRGAVRGAPAGVPRPRAARAGADRGRVRAALEGAGHARADRVHRRGPRRADRDHRARRRRQPAPADAGAGRRRRGAPALRRRPSRRSSTPPSVSAGP